MRFFCFFFLFFFYTFIGMNHAFWLLGAKGEVANFMTKMTCDQEHRTQVDTTWRHNGISDSHTDENSVIGVKKSASNRGIFNKNTQTIMKFSSEWIQEHLCLRWEPSQWVYLFVFDHIVSLLQHSVRCKQACTTGGRVTCEVGRFAWKKQEHVCNMKCEFRKPIL